MNTISPRFLRFAGAALLAIYFTCLLRDAPFMRFEIDDPSNVWIYWNAGFWRVLRANLTFWSSFYRPMGGLWLLSLYSLAKFNPLPYHIVRIVLIAGNVGLTWYFAKGLTGSGRIAWLTALLMTYHARLYGIYYSNSYIYDILCYLFFYGGFAYYVHVRLQGRLLGWLEAAVFLLLYICALNAKEIGAPLPLLVLLFELFYYPPEAGSISSWKRWLRDQARVPLLGCVLALIYTVGKRSGQDSMFTFVGYRPVFSWAQLWAQQMGYLNTWLYRWPNFTPATVRNFYLLLIWVAAVIKRPHVRLALSIALLGTLPITFVNGRVGNATYVPMFGWALLLATSISWIMDLFSRVPLFARLPYPTVQALLCGSVIFLFWRENERERAWIVPRFHSQQAKISDVIQEFERHAPEIRPHSKILITDDPFAGMFTTSFVARLWYADRSLEIFLANSIEPRPGPEQYKQFDYVLSITAQQGLIQVRP